MTTQSAFVKRRLCIDKDNTYYIDDKLVDDEKEIIFKSSNEKFIILQNQECNCSLVTPQSSSSLESDNHDNHESLEIQERQNKDTKENKKRSRKPSKKEMLDAKRLSKNRDAAQQSFLIALLCQYGYSFVIKRLYKKGERTSQMFNIERILHDDTVIVDDSSINNPFVNFKEKRQYLDAFMNNKMIELLESMGFSVQLRKTRKQTKQQMIILQRINKIIMNCKTITKDIIHEKGNDYNMEIKDLISFNSCIVDKDNCSFDHYLLK